MNDLSLTGLSDKPFKPEPPKPPTSNEQKAVEVAKKLEEANARLMKIIDQMREKLEQRYKGKKRGAAEPPDLPPGWENDMSWMENLHPKLDEWKTLANRMHAPGCPTGERNTNACTCKADSVGRGAGVRGCRDCKAVGGEPHTPECPRLRQKALFASELLRRKK